MLGVLVIKKESADLQAILRRRRDLKRLVFLVSLLIMPFTSGHLFGQDRLEVALASILDGVLPISSVKLTSFCGRDGSRGSVQIYGTGVAVWEGRAQFPFGKDPLMLRLKDLKRSGFPTWKEVYGGREDKGTEAGALKVICQVSLTIGQVTKTVSQLERGRQFSDLRELSNRILDGCANDARLTGVTIKDLSDGVEKLSSGELAPETFRLLLHQREGRAGVVLRLSERWLTYEVYDEARKLRETRKRVLLEDDLQELIRLLGNQRVQEFPGNLYAESYIEFSVEVLNRMLNVQARQFAGKTAETHGELQERFDRVIRELMLLGERPVDQDGSID